MPRIYTVEHEIAALNPTAGDSLLVIEAPDDLILQIIRVAVYNLNIDVHEMLHAGVFQVNVKGSLAGGGSAPVPRKHDNGDVASSVTVYEAGNAGMTTEPTSWLDSFDEQGWSNTAGYEYEPPYDARPLMSPSRLFGVRLMAVPSGAFQAKIVVTYAELGG